MVIIYSMDTHSVNSHCRAKPLDDIINKASFLKNCLGGLLARLIQVLDTTDVCLVASYSSEISLSHAAVLMKDFSVSTEQANTSQFVAPIDT